MLSFPGTGVRAPIAGLTMLAAVLAAASPGAAAGDGAEARIDGWLAANESFVRDSPRPCSTRAGFGSTSRTGPLPSAGPTVSGGELRGPEPQIIVADGERLWWYDIDLQQVTVRPVDAALEGTPASLLAGPDGRASRHFRAAALEPVRGVDWIELVPRGADAAFRALRVGLQGEELRAIEMEDGFGQTTRIDFFDVEYGPPLADELFRFVPPPEADVVRGD